MNPLITPGQTFEWWSDSDDTEPVETGEILAVNTGGRFRSDEPHTRFRWTDLTDDALATIEGEYLTSTVETWLEEGNLRPIDPLRPHDLEAAT